MTEDSLQNLSLKDLFVLIQDSLKELLEATEKKDEKTISIKEKEIQLIERMIKIKRNDEPS